MVRAGEDVATPSPFCFCCFLVLLLGEVFVMSLDNTGWGGRPGTKLAFPELFVPGLAKGTADECSEGSVEFVPDLRAAGAASNCEPPQGSVLSVEHRSVVSTLFELLFGFLAVVIVGVVVLLLLITIVCGPFMFKRWLSRSSPTVLLTQSYQLRSRTAASTRVASRHTSLLFYQRPNNRFTK
jgi:hypothetical protein